MEKSHSFGPFSSEQQGRKQLVEVIIFLVMFFLFIGVISAGLLMLLFSIPFLLLSSFLWVPALFALNWAVVGGYFGDKAKNLHHLLFAFFTRYVLPKWTWAYNWVMYKSNGVKRFIWRSFYSLMCRIYPKVEWTAMNYGFAEMTENGHSKQVLDAQDEPQRFNYQLYHVIASGLGSMADLRGKTVLEIGCGRGGGLRYVKEALSPQKCIGLDISRTQVAFCTRVHSASTQNLFFYQGDAENFSQLPALSGEKIDAIINIESSHCYGSFSRFVQNVSQVLSQEGYFMFTDFINTSDIPLIEKTFQENKLVLLILEQLSLLWISGADHNQKRKHHEQRDQGHGTRWAKKACHDPKDGPQT